MILHHYVLKKTTSMFLVNVMFKLRFMLKRSTIFLGTTCTAFMLAYMCINLLICNMFFIVQIITQLNTHISQHKHSVRSAKENNVPFLT